MIHFTLRNIINSKKTLIAVIVFIRRNIDVAIKEVGSILPYSTYPYCFFTMGSACIRGMSTMTTRRSIH